MVSKVAVVRTSPESILTDVRRVMQLGGAKEALDASATTILKNNLSWHLMFPGANTTPWQLEGAILALRDAGLTDLVCVENETVVTNARQGERLNKQRPVCEHYGVPIRYNFLRSDMEWSVVEPRAEMLVLHEIFPKGIRIPEYFRGKNVVHLPTMKCHIYTNLSGAMKNAFGGLLDNKRHYCHRRIHETLVDLLAIQKEIHPGIFAVTDGTTAGNGPGPRTMTPQTTNVLLASSDCVAIDAVAATMMGFQAMDHPFIRLAHERGLGVGRMQEIEIVGDADAAAQNWHFHTGVNAAGRVGKLFWFGPLRWLERLMFHTPVVYLFIFASAMYHDQIWYRLRGRKILRRWMQESPWGRLFADYRPGRAG
ncbi:MAG: iron-sulfur cluster-binding protein [Phycisphaerae bacterium SM23_33]|nr:MAG: iron-sulfur cluster-binding protein [Phycisphaerae bacterium SM23_33]